MASKAVNKTSDKVGAVLVIGGGIAGIQASLDLANSGQKVYLVERSPSIGGRMALLDKTFPTNDCSMCILSPKVVECGRHLNINLITCSELLSLDGDPGHFKAKILRNARYVDLEKCTGCGVCLGKCPKRPRKPEDMLHSHGAIYRPFPQALPNAPAIDRDMCLFLTKGTCGACKKACPSDAIIFDDKNREEVIDVGSVVVVPGFEEFQPEESFDTGYSRFPDVVTSMEFERMLCASGPFGGHVVRPSDGKEPHRIGFLQCVGSRDSMCRRGYCSSVCCMYAVKEAYIAREHMKEVETGIFFMDVRAFGKDFDKYCERAQKERGVKFFRGRVHSVESGKEGRLVVSYSPDAGGVSCEAFDLLVLSVGLEPGVDFRRLAKNLKLTVNEHGFIWTHPEKPLETSRPGVFAAGVASGPKDIPETVVQASAAACEARRILADVSGTLTREPVYPTERDVTKEAIRVGVFVCHCGTNIGGIVNVPGVAEYAKTLPGVAHAEDTLYACAQDTQGHILEVIKANNLNRVVVASCSPRTHEPLFQETLREAGLNPYYFEMANIRDQCSWIHMQDPAEATVKSKDLVRMAVAKVSLAEPLQAAELDVTHSALVLGGGLAGMSAALAIADQGFDVTLVEKGKELGGNLRRLRTTYTESDVPAYLDRLTHAIKANKRIKVFTGSTVTEVAGFVGNFESKVKTRAGVKNISHGAIVVATGAIEAKPTEYLYGKNRQVLTQMEFEDKLSKRNALSGVKAVAMIQCVGSRETGHQYCSRVCCNAAIKNALRIKEISPSTDVYILYRDIRSYGFNESHFQSARDKGVIFIRHDIESKPEVKGGARLTLKVKDSIADCELTLHPDLLVLSTRIDANHDNEGLSQLLKVPQNEDKFFLEAHVKLRPVEFATEGVFVAGLAHNPKNTQETICQAQAAAAKAVAIISQAKYDAEPTIAALNDDLCDGCAICVPVCEYNALEVIPRPGGKPDEKIVRLNEAMCKGCGGCVAACPSGAMEQKGFKNDQILAMIKAALVG